MLEFQAKPLFRKACLCISHPNLLLLPRNLALRRDGAESPYPIAI